MYNSIKLLLIIVSLGFSAQVKSFDIPFVDKSYSTFVECDNFVPKVDNQDIFVFNICRRLFDDSKALSEIGRKRLLCMRRGINSASTISQSRKVIFDCYEKFPHSNQSASLNVAKKYFKTAEEIAYEQLKNNQMQRQRQLPPMGFNCIVIGDMIDCI